ncbi:CGLD27 family protein [Lyngbya confervoides]|uniref:CGLD27 family protein n=1 Tax=Lyngbya confervoides BDU141951 TaxID=1574623 RepID=A0ABD4T4B4_9CYAN|nr:CGLD27 family protein [Lyngbya confervoides]MCM1983429.1 CGLD27 family protein [Lyngbya confervoides BDU141951]
MNVSIPNCPVPPEQLPLNEFQSLKESWFFRWSTLSVKQYGIRCLGIWMAFLLFSLPFAYEALVVGRSPLKIFLAANCGATIFMFLVLLRVYLGWRYVRDRLERDVVDYEETGWYDGQRWPKDQGQRDRDILISTYEVRPVMHRLLTTLGAVGSITVLSIFSIMIRTTP